MSDPYSVERTTKRQLDKALAPIENNNKLTTPVRCPACSVLCEVPDRQDVERAMEDRFAKCMVSDDPRCVEATSHPSVEKLRLRVQSNQARNAARHSNSRNRR